MTCGEVEDPSQSRPETLKFTDCPVCTLAVFGVRSIDSSRLVHFEFGEDRETQLGAEVGVLARIADFGRQAEGLDRVAAVPGARHIVERAVAAEREPAVDLVPKADQTADAEIVSGNRLDGGVAGLPVVVEHRAGAEQEGRLLTERRMHQAAKVERPVPDRRTQLPGEIVLEVGGVERTVRFERELRREEVAEPGTRTVAVLALACGAETAVVLGEAAEAAQLDGPLLLRHGRQPANRHGSRQQEDSPHQCSLPWLCCV
ncbi:MAG: hypothetical protein R2882_07805 [Gemmatimonadales bacterium]